MPEVPVSVWEQIPVVIVFAFLLAGLGWLLVREFSKAIADINNHYAGIVRQNNEQWQKYFDAKDENNRLVNEQVVKQLGELTHAIRELISDLRDHDQRIGEKIDELPTLPKGTTSSSQRRKN